MFIFNTVPDVCSMEQWLLVVTALVYSILPTCAAIPHVTYSYLKIQKSCK